MKRLALLVFLVACGGSSNKPIAPKPEPTPDPIPATAGPECKAVADHLVVVFLADKPDLQAAAADTFRTRCAEDKWSNEARSCFSTATNDAEADGCAKMLTAGQKTALEKAMAPPDAAMAPPPPKSVGAQAPGSPAPDAKPRTRGAVKKDPKKKGSKDGADPCQGGESDPCQGGQ